MPTKSLVTKYRDDLKLFPDMWHKVGLVLGVIIVLFYPFVAGSYWLSVGNLALVAVVGSVGLMILTGFTGQISLGHAAFLALGAYTAAVLGSRFGAPFWLIIPIAGAVAALVGLAVGPFALRLKGLYLAIVTLGLIFMVNHVLLSLPRITNGPAGIAVPMYPWFTGGGSGSMVLSSFNDTVMLGPLEFSFERKLFFIFLVIAVATTWCAKNLQRSNTGRAMAAVRDHDIAAAVMGVNPGRTKIIAFGISSFYAGVAGAMFAFQQQFLTVDPPFNLNMSVQYIAMIVLGGIGAVFGAVAGAVGFVFLSPLAEQIGKHIPLLNQLSSAQQSTLIFAFVVCFFLIFEPLGLLGIWLRIKRYFITWPFSY